MKAERAAQAVKRQLLLIPQIIDLDPVEAAQLVDKADLLAEFGLVVEAFGPGAVAVVGASPGISGAAVLAGIAEEAAYRGVGWQVLSWTLGDRSIVAMWILSVAFALAHRVQGWAAMVGIGVMAVLMHLLVWRTETLLVAIAVHVAYDVLVGLATPWRSAASHSAA